MRWHRLVQGVMCRIGCLVVTWYPRVVPFGRAVGSRSFNRLYERAITELLMILDELGVAYWLTEGTLIAASEVWSKRLSRDGPHGR